MNKIEIDPKWLESLRALYKRLRIPISGDELRNVKAHYDISLELGRELREALFDVVGK